MTDLLTPAPLGDNSEMYSITELAQELGVTPRTLRFYEDKGLLKPQRVGGTRIYVQRDRARLILILRGKRLGFSLREIGQYLDFYDADPTQRAQLGHLLELVQDRIKQLEQQKDPIEETWAELKEIEELALEAVSKSHAENETTSRDEANPPQVGTVLDLPTKAKTTNPNKQR